MQIVTVNLPSIYVAAIKKLTDDQLYPSRSEAIRVALRNFLKKELEMVELLIAIKDNQETSKKDRLSYNPKQKIDMRSIRRGWPSKT